MSRLIKSGEQRVSAIERMRPITVAQLQDVSKNERFLGLQAELSGLNLDLQNRDAEIATLGREVAAAFIDGEKKGLLTGLSAGEDRQVERLKVLSDGVQAAVEVFSLAINDLERLSGEVARASLEKIFGPSHEKANLLPDLIRHQVSQLERQSILAVEVSSEDFPDEDQLVQLAKSIGRSDLHVLASNDMAAGDCRIKLSLGGLDIGLHQQWGRLSDVLDGLEQGDAV